MLELASMVALGVLVLVSMLALGVSGSKVSSSLISRPRSMLVCFRFGLKKAHYKTYDESGRPFNIEFILN